MVMNSINPKPVVRAPMITPTARSQFEARAQNSSPVPQKARSVASAPIRKAIGNIAEHGVDWMAGDSGRT